MGEDDVVVSQRDIDDVTRDVLQKDKEREQRIREEAKEELRKEMEAEQQKKKLLDDKLKLEAALLQKEKENAETVKKLKEDAEKLREQIGQSKGFVNTNNPFSQGESEDNRQEINIDELTPEQINAIDEASKNAFKGSLSGKNGSIGRVFKDW